MNSLEKLKILNTELVADTGDIKLIKKYRPLDVTTNPSLILSLCSNPEYKHLLSKNGDLEETIVNFGYEIYKEIDGYVSTEVNPVYSYDIDKTIELSLKIIKLYKNKGVDIGRILIKIASTWQGIKAAEILERDHNIRCNMTLIFSIEQAIMCGESNVTLISPFVGRIYDWYKKNYPNIPEDIKEQIYNQIGDHDNGEWYFIKRLARGIAKIASAFSPNEVIVRFSDFKSNEYKNLIGGSHYEPTEENPMIGWRGASRYYSDEYRKSFELECEAIKYVRNVMNMKNVVVMIPFCRTVEECKNVLDIMSKCGLKRGEDGLKLYLMCEIPSNVIEADEFSPYIDGVSIGGNDLLQLTLGVDRDSEKITHLSNHENLSYRRLISKAIKDYKKNGIKVGFCGQQPSDSIDFCKFLIENDIDTISVTPDSLLNTLNNLIKN